MNEKQLKELWLQDEKMSFQGWDFSYLDKRWETGKTTWDYDIIVQQFLKDDMKLLDMGTGGGEYLLSLQHPYENTSVTEAWQPNVDLCFEKLKPLGITVRQVFDDSYIPYEDNSFDLVINRHEAYDVNEVRRILKPNGLFISQQVGGANNRPLSEKLIKDFLPLYPDLTLANELNKWGKAGFEVVYREECFPKLYFYDVGAIVYFAKVIEWEFPNFSVEANFPQLLELHKQIEVCGYVESMEHRFLLVLKINK